MLDGGGKSPLLPLTAGLAGILAGTPPTEPCDTAPGRGPRAQPGQPGRCC